MISDQTGAYADRPDAQEGSQGRWMSRAGQAAWPAHIEKSAFLMLYELFRKKLDVHLTHMLYCCSDENQGLFFMLKNTGCHRKPWEHMNGTDEDVFRRYFSGNIHENSGGGNCACKNYIGMYRV